MGSGMLTARVRGVWEELTGGRVRFEDGRFDVALVADSPLCPLGWAGVVAVGDAAVCTVPTASSLGPVRAAVERLGGTEALGDVDRLRALMPVEDVMGPAALAYLEASAFRPSSPQPRFRVEELSVSHPEVGRLLDVAGKADAEESGLGELGSPAFVVRGEEAGGELLAAAGYARWPCSVAHVCVLTAPAARGRGLAGVAASAAVRHALDAGLLPQWRARPEASRRVARRLGFVELGRQVSLRLAAG